ncbi:MAG: PH domain-containing protein [Patescibacteria group bacterium]
MPLSPHARFNAVLAGLVLLVLAYVFGRAFYDARGLGYALESRALVIRHRGRIVIPYARMEKVTFYRTPPPMRKMQGTSLGRIRFGRFRLQGVEGEVTVYAADASRPLLLVETPEAKYGLTPADGEAFYRRLLARIERSKPEASLGAG